MYNICWALAIYYISYSFMETLQNWDNSTVRYNSLYV